MPKPRSTCSIARAALADDGYLRVHSSTHPTAAHPATHFRFALPRLALRLALRLAAPCRCPTSPTAPRRGDELLSVGGVTVGASQMRTHAHAHAHAHTHAHGRTRTHADAHAHAHAHAHERMCIRSSTQAPPCRRRCVVSCIDLQPTPAQVAGHLVLTALSISLTLSHPPPSLSGGGQGRGADHPPHTDGPPPAAAGAAQGRRRARRVNDRSGARGERGQSAERGGEMRDGEGEGQVQQWSEAAAETQGVERREGRRKR